jgi:hypothetical protein
MKLWNKILTVFSPGRSITGELVDKLAFWTEVQRASFLLRNLKDDDLNWARPYYYLHQVDYITNNNDNIDSELEAIRHLYLGWVSIAVQVDTFQDAELDIRWLYRLDASAQHIFERILPRLTLDHQNAFIENIPGIHRICNEQSRTSNSI